MIIVKAEVEIPHLSSLGVTSNSLTSLCTVLGSRRLLEYLGERIRLRRPTSSPTDIFAMDSDDDNTLDLENPQLRKAAAYGDLEQCQALLEQWKQRLTPAHITARHLASTLAAAIRGKHPQVVSYLVKQGAVISGNDMVLALGNTDDSILMFQTFLDNGWDINGKTDLGNVMLKYIILRFG